MHVPAPAPAAPRAVLLGGEQPRPAEAAVVLGRGDAQVVLLPAGSGRTGRAACGRPAPAGTRAASAPACRAIGVQILERPVYK